LPAATSRPSARGDRAAPAVAAVAALVVILGLWLLRVGIHLHESPPAPASSLFADSSRAFGIAALVIGVGVLPVGLLVGRRVVRGHRAARLRTLHRSLALWCLGALALHVTALAGATALHPSIVRLVVPFAWRYHALATALGVLGAWVVAVLGLSYYQRRRIGVGRWRVAHRLIVLGLVLGVVHTIGGG
jgi:sulfoxide reductase heme-binding subunit YedZ